VRTLTIIWADCVLGIVQGGIVAMVHAPVAPSMQNSYEAIEACVRSHNSWLHMPGEQWVRVSLDHILRILLPVVALAVLTLVQPETTSAISQLTLRGVTGSHVPVYRVMDYISQNTGFPYMDSPA